MSGRRKRKGDDRKKQKRVSSASCRAKSFGVKRNADNDEEDYASAQLPYAQMEMDVDNTIETVQELADAVKKISASLRLEVRRVAHPCDLKTPQSEAHNSKVIYFVPIDCVQMGECPLIDNEIEKCTTEPMGIVVIGCRALKFVRYAWTTARLRSNLSDILGQTEDECVMCFEDLGTDTTGVSPYRQSLICNQCGTLICFVCVVKLTVENRQLMQKHPYDSHNARFQCPLCRFDRNLYSFPSECGDIVMKDFLHEFDDSLLHAEILANAKLCKAYGRRKIRPISCSFCEAPFASKRVAKKALACDTCKYNRYCSRRCRLKDKKKHKKLCRLWCLK